MAGGFLEVNSEPGSLNFQSDCLQAGLIYCTLGSTELSLLLPVCPVMPLDWPVIAEGLDKLDSSSTACLDVKS